MSQRFLRSITLPLCLAGLGSVALQAQGQELGDSWYGELSCLVEPGRQALLSSQVPGVIETIQVEPGDRVAAG